MKRSVVFPPFNLSFMWPYLFDTQCLDELFLPHFHSALGILLQRSKCPFSRGQLQNQIVQTRQT